MSATAGTAALWIGHATLRALPGSVWRSATVLDLVPPTTPASIAGGRPRRLSQLHLWLPLLPLPSFSMMGNMAGFAERGEFQARHPVSLPFSSRPEEGDDHDRPQHDTSSRFSRPPPTSSTLGTSVIPQLALVRPTDRRLTVRVRRDACL